MRSAYNYTLVERHKQKVYIPYIGIEFSGWIMLIGMLVGVILGVLLIGTPLAFLIGDFGYVLSLGISAIAETVAVTFMTEIDRTYGKNKLLSFYYRSVKNYRVIYDKYGTAYYLSKKKRGVMYDVCGSD